jgi:hypothetical protein
MKNVERTVLWPASSKNTDKGREVSSGTVGRPGHLSLLGTQLMVT